MINAKISNKTTNSFLTSNNDQDIHPDDQHGWSLHHAHVDPKITRVDHPSQQIHIAVRLQQPRQQWCKLALEPEAWNRAPRPEGTDWAPFQKNPFQTNPCQTSQSYKGFKHKSNQRRAQQNQSWSRFIGTFSQASETDAKPRKSQQNFFYSQKSYRTKTFSGSWPPIGLKPKTEHEVQCRWSAEFVQPQRVLPLMPLATAAIGCAINNLIAPKSSDFGKPMRHCECKNNE